MSSDSNTNPNIDPRINGQKDVPTSYQPEQGSPVDVQGEEDIRQSAPASDRMNQKNEEAMEEA
ncbi:MAG TPA: hypothetical protein V6D10_16940 [Trichocoleus sp.]|jgi:hypothetical protein